VSYTRAQQAEGICDIAFVFSKKTNVLFVVADEAGQ
jgi:hypothetical protein